MTALLVLYTACSPDVPAHLEGMTVDDGRRELMAHLEDAMAHIEDQAVPPTRQDDTPAPCFDNHLKAPDFGKARVDYVVEVAFGKSYEAAVSVREGLKADGWSISTNTGAPEEMLMFTADNGDYLLLVSGSKGKDVGSLLVGGESPCLPKEADD